jgi:serpin B
MFAATNWGSLRSTLRIGRHRTAPRGILAALSVAVLVGACAGSAATPVVTPGATPTQPATLTPSATPQATPTGTPIPSARIVNGDSFDMAVGNGTQAAPDMAAVGTAGDAINDFGFDLLRRLDISGNSCSSPTSIALALAMVRPGARGETAAQMDTVLRSFGAPGSEARTAALIARLNAQTMYDPFNTPAPGNSAQPIVTLNVSDQIFGQTGMPLLPDYLDAIAAGFGAGIGQLDFAAAPEDARKVINAWVARNTANRIPEILQSGDITPMTRIALANAIYLNAGWVREFNEDNTTNRPFTTAAGTTVQVRTMAQEAWFEYAAGTGYRVVDMPLGGDTSTLSMTIIMPDDLASFVAGLSAAKLASIVAAEKTYDVSLTLPRFSAEFRTDLAAQLQAMGMTDLFSDAKADLSGINGNVPEPLVIAAVIHQANIDVFEKGTTAAAATVVIGRATTGGDGTLPPKTTFHVDHPFLYLLRETTSGAVLFMGTIGSPSSN